jgi:hypothetical protein
MERERWAASSNDGDSEESIQRSHWLSAVQLLGIVSSILASLVVRRLTVPTLKLTYTVLFRLFDKLVLPCIVARIKGITAEIL